jgi:hypothetical protein
MAQFIKSVKEWLPVVIALGLFAVLLLMGIAFEVGKLIAIWKYIFS